jgi:hypothetical protein
VPYSFRTVKSRWILEPDASFGFVAFGTMHSTRQSGEQNGYGPMNNPAVNRYLSQDGYSSSLFGLTKAKPDEGLAFISSYTQVIFQCRYLSCGRAIP